MTRSEVVRKYRISRTTISEWLRDYGSAAYHSKQRGRLSEANKTSMLRAIEGGQITIREAMLSYRVSSNTIRMWIRKYQKEKGELVSPMAIKDPSKKKKSDDAGQEEVEALKKALLEAQLKIQALNTLIDVAEDKFKIAIRKKPGAKQSSE